MYKPLQGVSIPMQPVTGHDGCAGAHRGTAMGGRILPLVCITGQARCDDDMQGTAVMAGLAA